LPPLWLKVYIVSFRIIGTQQHTVSDWENGLNRPRGANLKALRELQKKAKAKTK
jgi:DNA-binding transcriptional regulator YiaG